jgi:putative membrane protein
MGTTYGIPFGAYSYTALLGTKWFDRVPLLIPLSWFTMSWACWVIARHRASGWSAILLGTSLLVAWDLLLDPAMSRVTSYWIWGEAGDYYGMPWMNLVGWGVTGLVLFIVLSKLIPEPHGSRRFALWVYLVNYALPLGFCILNRYWLAALVSPLSIALAWTIFGNSLGGAERASASEPGFSAAGALSSRRD